MSDRIVVDTTELDAFLRDLRRVGSDLPRKVRLAEKEAVGEIAEWGKSDLSKGGHPTQRHVARLKAVRAKVTGRRAAVRIDASAKRNAMALGATIGSKAHSQFPAYSDPAWSDGFPRGGYAPFSTLRDRIADVREIFLDAVDDALDDAFPN